MHEEGRDKPIGADPRDFLALDRIDAERFSPLGAQPVAVFDAGRDGAAEAAARLAATAGTVTIGFSRGEALLAAAAKAFDVLLTESANAPAPWVSVRPGTLEREVGRVEVAVESSPRAASVLCRLLRMNGALAFTDALQLESMAYSMLLGGGEFRQWRAGRGEAPMPGFPAEPVTLCERDGRTLVHLNDPANHNAMSAPMRDALYNALVNALEDPRAPQVELRGEGRCFSTGGLLEEFGSAGDLAQAHLVRTGRSCARLIHELGHRGSVLFHGACVGSGLEIPAAAGLRRATAGSWFQLPEVGMGLIPGAGGTVTLPRAIGRHRTCYMALGGRRHDARTALQWGLVHEIVGAQPA